MRSCRGTTSLTNGSGKKLQELRLTPSAPVDDAKFIRRAFLDVIGRMPAPAEVRAFLSDPSPQKRQVLVDHLLQRPEYADYWANKWMDLLRPNPYRVGVKAVLNYDDWIRNAFRRNQPYDQFVRELLTAQGSTWRNGAVTLFRDRRSPEEITTLASQLFLGIRLECAKCHHHPFEKWSQHDFYSLAAYFGRIGRKGADLSPPISGAKRWCWPAAAASAPSATGRSARAAALVWRNAGRRSDSGSPPGVGRLDHVRRESVLSPGDCQSHLGRLDGPRHR